VREDRLGRWAVGDTRPDVAVQDLPIAIDHKDGRNCDRSPRHGDAVGRDHAQARVGEQREAQAETTRELAGVLHRVGADTDELGARPPEGLDLPVQLTELTAAEGSPVATIEHEDHTPVPGELGEADPAPIGVGEGEGRGERPGCQHRAASADAAPADE